MSSQVTTSGVHGINGDLYANGTITASTINASTAVQINGVDITESLQNVAATEAQVASWAGGSAVPHATLSDTSTVANKIKSADGPTSVGIVPIALSTLRSGDSSVLTSGNFNFNLSTVTMGVYNARITHNCDIDGTTTLLSQLHADGGILIPAGQSLICNGPLYANGGESEIETLSVSGALNQSGGNAVLGSSSTNLLTVNSTSTFVNGITTNGLLSCPGGLVVSGNPVDGRNQSFVANTGAYIKVGCEIEGNVYQYGSNYWKRVKSNNMGFMPDYQFVVTIYPGVLTNNFNPMYNNACYMPEYTVLAVQVSTNPSLQVADPQSGLQGREMKFIRDIMPASTNGCLLVTTSTGGTVGGFIVSGVATSTFQLGNSGNGWFKAFFVCLQMSDSKYYWVQTYYQ